MLAMCTISHILWQLLLLLGADFCTAVRDGAVRLVGGKLSSEGRVEVYHDGKWGTVCDDSWDMAEAQVVCRQLRYPGAQLAVPGAAYGRGSGPIWLDDMSCQGSEGQLASCKFKGWGVTDCSHNEDAGVVCMRNSQLANDQVYNLDHSAGLADDLEKLFDSGHDCDFNITMLSSHGKDTDAEETICLHRLVISLTSSSSILKSYHHRHGITLNVTQDCQPHASSFFRYLYTRKIDITISSIQCIHQLATDFGMTWLQEEVGRFFTWLLPGDPTFKAQASLYEYSVRTKDQVLQETCLQYLAWNFEALVNSSVWSSLAQDTVAALLVRSDLVAPSEAFLLEGLENWILAKRQVHGKGDAEGERALLGLVRFPMIPAEVLYELPDTSELYSSHQELYRSSMLLGFQFNSVPIHKLKKHAEHNTEHYLPRIYTSSPWSIVINATRAETGYPYNQYYRYDRHGTYNSFGQYQMTGKSFETPLHNSIILQSTKVSWSAHVYLTKQECANNGYSCESVPAAQMTQTSSVQHQKDTRFSNRVLLTCDGHFIFHVQDFKDNFALIPSNTTAYPCHKGPYLYRFTVRPEYV